MQETAALKQSDQDIKEGSTDELNFLQLTGKYGKHADKTSDPIVEEWVQFGWILRKALLPKRVAELRKIKPDMAEGCAYVYFERRKMEIKRNTIDLEKALRYRDVADDPAEDHVRDMFLG